MMDTNFTMKTADGEINIDPQLLCQRLVIAGTRAEKLPDAVRYELCALFESRHVLLVANKPVLATATWDLKWLQQEKKLWFVSTKANQQILSIRSDFQDFRKRLNLQIFCSSQDSSTYLNSGTISQLPCLPSSSRM